MESDIGRNWSENNLLFRKDHIYIKDEKCQNIKVKCFILSFPPIYF